MGLFDRIKNAFVADKSDEEEKKVEQPLEEPVDLSDSEGGSEHGEVETTGIVPAAKEEVESDEATTESIESEVVESVEPTKAETVEPPTVESNQGQSAVNPLMEDQLKTPTVQPTEDVEEPPTLTEPADQVVESETNSVATSAVEPTEPVVESSTVEVKSDTPTVDTESAVSEDDMPVAPVELADTTEDTITPEIESPEMDSAETESVEATESDDSVQEKYDKGLAKTRKSFGERMNEFFARFRRVDEDFFEELEETLIGADVGFDMAMKLTDSLREEVKLKNAKKPAQIQNIIIEKMVDIYEEEGVGEDNSLNLQTDGPTVFLFVGVNGTGKTTSIGKLANQYKQEGKKVLLAAADTFRAGAIDQLVVWGERSGVEVVRGNAGGDPAAVVYDAVAKAKNEAYDILLIDTAGRLQNKVNLMNELEKIKRVIQREFPSAPHEVLLVVDATTGQNAMVQARQFKETTDVTGLVLTKLDGTAKGGIVLAIRNELHLPVKLVGLGEGINDLEPFDPNEFAVGLFKGLLKEE